MDTENIARSSTYKSKQSEAVNMGYNIFISHVIEDQTTNNISTSCVNYNKEKWIVDTGTTNYMVSN